MTQRQYISAMSLLRHTSSWEPRVMTCSALQGVNIDSVWAMLCEFQSDADRAIATKRSRQNSDWMRELMNEMLLQKLAQNTAVKAMLPELEEAVEREEVTAFAAVRAVMAKL